MKLGVFWGHRSDATSFTESLTKITLPQKGGETNADLNMTTMTSKSTTTTTATTSMAQKQQQI
jgi:hypothetical protein